MTEPIPFIDLVAQYQTIKSDIDAAVQSVLTSQKFILGEKVAQFEENLASWMGLASGGVVGVSSGTDALLASLMALGVGPGDEVLTTPFSFFATAGVIARLNAKPVFIDIEPHSFNLDTEKLKDFDPKRFKAAIVVHVFGRCANLDQLNDWAKSGGVAVVEDAAQAIGARFEDGTHAGTKGSLGCFSFFPTKNLGAAGDAGCIVAADPELLEEVRRIRVHGAVKKYENQVVGGNFRLDAIQAAILDAKLPYLKGWTEAKKDNARSYDQRFRELGLAEVLSLPSVPDSENYVAHQYVVRLTDRDGLKAHLQKLGIASAIYYPAPFHVLPAFRYLGYKEGDFPVAERACQEALALPLYPELGPARLARIVEAVQSFFQG